LEFLRRVHISLLPNTKIPAQAVFRTRFGDTKPPFKHKMYISRIYEDWFVGKEASLRTHKPSYEQ
jgi:hypothetical protein